MTEDKKKKDVIGDPLPVKDPDKGMKSLVDFEEAIMVIRASLPTQIEFQTARAQINWALYTESIKVGFNPEQAMELVIAKGI